MTAQNEWYFVTDVITWGQKRMNAKLALYSAVDDELTRYEVDVEGASLVRRETIKVLANVQYAWPHPSGKYLYVATSNRGPGLKADFNRVSAFTVDAITGALSPHGEPAKQYARAVHICVNPAGDYLLSAHNLPKTGITVNRINADGTIGREIQQPEDLDYGIYPHQVMMTPSNRVTILVDRGNSAHEGKAEDPGALRLFRFNDGLFSVPAVVAPNSGYGFGPRHLDFHPDKPWVYVSLERQSTLNMFRMYADSMEPQAAYARDMLQNRQSMKGRQLAGTVHVHSNGRFVYSVNRADDTAGENSIAVYALDQATGEPTPIQHADTHSIHVRTFAIDPSGRLLVAASVKAIDARTSAAVTRIPASLTVFRISDDGKLEFVRKYDVEHADRTQYWMGIVNLPDAT